MLSRSLLLPLLLVLLSSSLGLAGDNQTMIEQLGHDIKHAEDSLTKSRLHMYRARQYTRAREWEKALEDYNQALELNHQGWIHLERSHFLMAAGKYKLAYNDAMATKREMPTLAYEADKIIELAVAKLRKQYEIDNPPTIILDTVVDPNRKTRFDVMEERGVFAARARMISQLRQQNMAVNKKKQQAAARPTKSRG